VTEASGPGRPALAAGREVLAGAWVLAGGRYLGGGIAKRDAAIETLLGLPVIAGGEPARSRTPGSLTARDSRSDQPLLEAGVAFDRLLRPLDASGRPAHERLFAAGALLSGWEPPADGSGLGCSLFTGWLAGRAAAGVG
jgi:glycerol-3-phosphate dehydrogenase subunit B